MEMGEFFCGLFYKDQQDLNEMRESIQTKKIKTNYFRTHRKLKIQLKSERKIN